jgi:AraC-like DNA-binding protein
VWRTRRVKPYAGTDTLIRELRHAEPIAPRPASRSLARFTESLHSGIARAASSAGLSREHASRMYRRHFGLAPRAARGEMQFRLALSLLATTDLPLAEVALQAGFADQAHFTRRIRSATGRTPRQIRQGR